MVVGLEVFVDDGGLAAMITTMSLSKGTLYLVLLYLTTLEPYCTSFFKETLSFVRTFNDFERAILLYVLYHAASLDALSTIVLTLHFKLKAIIHNMLIHTSQWYHVTTLQDALYNPIGALVKLMLL